MSRVAVIITDDFEDVEYTEPVKAFREKGNELIHIGLEAGSTVPIFAICHAAQLLITAQALQGRGITGWKSIEQDIKNAGADFLDQEVVEDGNLISSRGPQDLPAFVEASLRHLH